MKDNDHRAGSEQFDPTRLSGRSSSRHPAPAQVSLCREGGLEPLDAAAVRAHLKSCARCRRTQAKLSEVRRVLGHQANRSMPTRIASQLDQALIAEASTVKGQWPPRPRSASLYS
jgi:anti-sigma factor ChrR (cupin superfamily)